MFLLPVDWSERRAHPFDEAIRSSYANLLGLGCDITILSEGLVGFNLAKLSLEEELDQAFEACMRALEEVKQVAKKVRWAAKEVKKVAKEEAFRAKVEVRAKLEKVGALEGLVTIEHGAIEVLHQKVAELEEALELGRQ
ncbi:hypothetical protein COCNU_14G007460 [Cocos nucifera]|uniref:Uncharacterized protein n=1 Tax=Cocos nucifera TaxID=13894 RepID=A0A8K0NCH4_COCNU|nr:hypothetical protein COCNU_14G007460 [Cocos nucifera]